LDSIHGLCVPFMWIVRVFAMRTAPSGKLQECRFIAEHSS